jgi:hypothetical protein
MSNLNINSENNEKFITIVMPYSNKLSTLSDVDTEIECSLTRTTSALVVKTCEVDEARFIYLSNNLLECTPEWFGVGGGSFIEPKYLQGLNPDSYEYQSMWDKYSYHKVVEIMNKTTGEQFLVDTQGYGYARYVGRLS